MLNITAWKHAEDVGARNALSLRGSVDASIASTMTEALPSAGTINELDKSILSAIKSGEQNLRRVTPRGIEPIAMPSIENEKTKTLLALAYLLKSVRQIVGQGIAGYKAVFSLSKSENSKNDKSTAASIAVNCRNSLSGMPSRSAIASLPTALKTSSFNAIRATAGSIMPFIPLSPMPIGHG